MNSWFTADTHYDHVNIVRGTSKWGDTLGQRTRDFDTLEEHNQTIVDNINRVVKESDILYHIGDWSFNGIDNIWNFRKQIKCNHIHFIIGNHDHHIQNNKQVLIPREDEQRYSIISGYDIPANNKINGKSLVNVRDFFDSVGTRLIKKINGQSMFLDHFSHRVWEKAAHGVWMLYGHSHGSIPEYGKETYDESLLCWTKTYFKTMDVGLDTHPEFRPYHFDEIAAIMKDRVNLVVDHHNEHTN